MSRGNLSAMASLYMTIKRKSTPHRQTPLLRQSSPSTGLKRSTAGQFRNRSILILDRNNQLASREQLGTGVKNLKKQIQELRDNSKLPRSSTNLKIKIGQNQVKLPDKNKIEETLKKELQLVTNLPKSRKNLNKIAQKSKAVIVREESIANLEQEQAEQPKMNVQLFNRLKRSEELLKNKIREEEILREKYYQIQNEYKLKCGLIQTKISENRENFQATLERLTNNLQQQKRKIAIIAQEKSLYLREAKRMELILMSKTLKNTEQQTKFKNVAKGVISAHWYTDLNRAKILKRIVFNHAQHLQLLPSAIDAAEQGLYKDCYFEHLGVAMEFRSEQSKIQDKIVINPHKTYEFVINYLAETSPLHLQNLIDQPVNYIGMFGVWLYNQGEWETVIVDDRFSKEIPGGAGSPALWNIVICKAIIKVLGGIQNFKNVTLQRLFQLLTGCCSFSIRTLNSDPHMLVKDIKKWMHEGKLVTATQNLKENQQRYYLVENMLEVERKQFQPQDYVIYVTNVEGQSFYIKIQYFDFRVMRLSVMSIENHTNFHSLSIEGQPSQLFAVSFKLSEAGKVSLRFFIKQIKNYKITSIHLKLYRIMNGIMVRLGQTRQRDHHYDMTFFEETLEPSYYTAIASLDILKEKINKDKDIRLIDIIKGVPATKGEHIKITFSVQSNQEVTLQQPTVYTPKGKKGVSGSEIIVPFNNKLDVQHQLVKKIRKESTSQIRNLNQLLENLNEEGDQVIYDLDRASGSNRKAAMVQRLIFRKIDQFESH